MSDLKSKVDSLLAKAERQESISLIDGCISFSVQYVLESGFKVSGVALYLETDAFTLLEARAIAKEHATSDLLKLETYAECQKAFEDRKIFTGTPIAPSFELKTEIHAPENIDIGKLKEDLNRSVQSVLIRELKPNGLLSDRERDERSSDRDFTTLSTAQGKWFEPAVDRRKEVMGALEKLTIELGEDPAYENYAWDWSGMSLQELEKELEALKNRVSIKRKSDYWLNADSDPLHYGEDL